LPPKIHDECADTFREPEVRSSMALGAESARRPFAAAGGVGDGSAGAAPPVFLAADMDGLPWDPMMWGDEKRMKRELVAWAKAVASIALRLSAGTPCCRRQLVAVNEIDAGDDSVHCTDYIDESACL
jgi:hypothetical protein